MGPNPGTVPPASTPAGGTPDYAEIDRQKWAETDAMVLLTRWCRAEKHLMHEGSGMLLCSLAEGHATPHWDGVDDITWKDGKPDA